MFTASVFKDLLLPLLNDIKNSLIYIPLKSSSDCDFTQDLNVMLSNSGLDPRNFSGVINKLNNFRKNVNSISSTQTEMFNYFIELEYISARFSVKNFNFLIFSWTNAFQPSKQESQTSMAFEKSNILFNIGARINNESLSNLDIGTIKSSVRDLCISGTIFDWISTNFANAPLDDIKSDFSKFLSCICLLQAQEISFFASIYEEKGLKTLARLSLGVMNLIQSAREYISAISHFDASWIDQKLREKEEIHGFIHCLIMAEFWDGQELYDIAYDLFSTSSRFFENSSIKCKDSIRDYIKISILRSEKERQQISYEGKRAADSKVKLDPYFLATVLDFKSIIGPYSSSYTSLFVNVYPIRIIELQSEFEAKANTIIKTLERANEEVTVSFDNIASKVISNPDSFIFELRSNLINGDIANYKETLIEIDIMLEEISSLKKHIHTKYPESNPINAISDVEKVIKSILEEAEQSKTRLILNDSALVQTLMPLMKDIYISCTEESKDILRAYEENSKKYIYLYENLANEIKSTDLREAFLGADNPSNFINAQINIFDNSAIEILRIIEAQRNLAVKCQQIWNHLLNEGTHITKDTLPRISEVDFLLTTLASKLNIAKESILKYINERNENEKYISLQYKAKLNEMLNKY